MSAPSSRRRLAFIASCLATAALVLAGVAWAHFPASPDGTSSSGGSLSVGQVQKAAGGRPRKLTVAITPSRPADAAGWYRSPVTFTTSGTDSRGNPLTCTAPQTYGGPDVSHVAIVGTCTDAMGRIQSSTFDLRYDATAPVVTASAGRVPDHNGWYNAATSVSFAGQDLMSGGVTCSPAAAYDGPDSADATIVGTCSDAAGNLGSGSIHIAYDATAPVVTVDADRAADHNGWFNSPVTFSTHGSDAVSGLVDCSLQVTYLAPDTAAGAQSGSCSDAAGNTGTGRAQFKYDSTAPTATAVPSSVPNANGWYRTKFDVSFTGSDATSGPVSCSPTASYSGPDVVAASLAGACTDQAGNSAPASYDFGYDATAPTVTPGLARAADHGGWYNHPVDTAFTGTDATSGGVSCAVGSYGGPDSATASVTSTCTDAAGNTSSAAQPFAYDDTAPSVTVTATRPPDAGSSYTSPVSFDVTGSDATSGGVTCDGPITYSGPDSASATVTGNCVDAAGNTGTGSAAFGYQTTVTVPDTSLVSTPATLTNQASAQFVFVASTSPSTFRCSLDGAAASDCTSPQSYSGLADGQHTFSVAAADSAGNSDPTPATFSWTIDTVAPDTAFTATPPDPNNTAASFTITTDADASLECSLDNTAFAACSSPVSIPTASLPDGSHTFRARGIDAAGNVDATPASFTWTTDTVAPTITLGSTPAAVATTTTAIFTWTSNEPGAYSCRIDTAVFASCGSGISGTKTITGLTQGNHTFNVRARDAAGNLSPTVSFGWAVDTGPPDTTISSKPASPTAATSAGFTFTATEPSTFKCKLDNAAFGDCTSPQSYTGLADGSHTFAVEAVDAVGNVDPTPATFTWVVDITKPTGSITTPTETATVSGNTQPVTALAADNVSVLNVQFKLDGGDLGTPVTAAPYTVTWDTTVTADGPHTLTAVITDEVGNTTTTAPVHVTVQNATPPLP